MSERSVAEIIGWVRCDCGEGCAWVYPTQADADVDINGRHDFEVKPTVDDLLAWINSKAHACEISLYEDGSFKVDIDKCADYWSVEGDTVLEALERVDRAIDAEERARIDELQRCDSPLEAPLPVGNPDGGVNGAGEPEIATWPPPAKGTHESHYGRSPVGLGVWPYASFPDWFNPDEFFDAASWSHS